MIFFRFLCLFTVGFLSFTLNGVSQTPPNGCGNACGTFNQATYLPSQDCAGAIPLCKLKYTYPTGAVCGPGRLACEIPGQTCMGSGERNTTWYSFTVRSSGLLEFLIRPLDAIGNDQGRTDYDWIVIKVPSGLNINTNTCEQIKYSGRDWVLSCNYSGLSGTTGMYDTSFVSHSNSFNNAKFNRPLQVIAGETYLLAVDNFTGGLRIGYDIQFTQEGVRGAASILPEGLEAGPKFENVQKTPDCTDNLFLFNFNQPIRCGNIRPSGFTIKTKLRNTNTIVQNNIQITEFRPASGACNEAAQQFHLRFNPIRATDELDYWIVLKDTIFDVCGNYTIRDSLMFRISPFVNLLNSIPNNQNCQNSSSITLTAQTDNALRIAPAQVSYQWKVRRSNLLFTSLGSEQGDNFILSGTNGSTIQINSANTVDIQNTFRIRVIAETTNGCLDSNEIQVNTTPSGQGTILSGPTCSNNLISLSYVGFSNSSYQWTVPAGVVIVGDPTLSNISVLAPQNGTYTIRVRELSNRGCLGPELTKTITVSSPPILPQLPRSVTICQGEIVSLGYPEDDPNLSYSWEPAYFFESPTSHQTNIRSNNWGNTLGMFKVKNNITGCITFDTIAILINKKPVRPTIVGTSNFVCNNSVVSLTSTPAYSYRWSNGSQEREINVNQPGSYTVRTINEFGCESELSAPFVLNIERPTGRIVGNSTVCPRALGERYFVTTTSIMPINRYLWIVEGGQIIGNNNQPNVIINWDSRGDSTGRILLIPIGPNNCLGDTIRLIVNLNSQLAPRFPSGDSLICAVGQRTSDYRAVGSPGSNFTWQVSNGEIIEGQGTSLVRVQWNAGISEGEIWYIERNNPTNPLNCEGTSLKLRVSFIQNPLIPPLATGKENYCGVNDTIIINFGLSVGSTINFGTINGLRLISNQNGVAKFSASTNGTYIVRFFERTSANCIGPMGEFRFNITESPQISLGVGKKVCANQPLIIGPDITQPNTNYLWSPETNINNTRVGRTTFIAPTSGMYRYKLRVSNPNSGCYSEDSITITVLPAPERPTISSLSGNLLCSGEIFRLRASEGLTYRWSNGATSREVNVSGPQRLSVTVFSSEGCASLSSEEVELAYRADLTTSLSENNQFICPEQFEGLSYRVKGNDGSGFSWGVLGGSIMENQGSSIKVNWQTGTSLRQVSVVETSSFGCVGAEQTLAIEVDELVNNPASGCEITNYQLGVPNVISPNADGFNDLFELKNLRYYPDLELEIFNRFGKQVAYFKPYNNSFSANALPAGTYFYRIVSGRGQTLKGWLDVVR